MYTKSAHRKIKYMYTKRTYHKNTKYMYTKYARRKIKYMYTKDAHRKITKYRYYHRFKEIQLYTHHIFVDAVQYIYNYSS